jgi:hypothetical protein
MDVRAFGSRYGFSAGLPYASGFNVPSGTTRNFPACRAVYVESANKNADKTLTVIFADAKAPVTFSHIRTDVLLPISITQISGTSTVEHCYILY